MNARSLLPEKAPGVLSLGEATEFSDSGIVSRTILASGQTRVVLFGFAAGQELSEHATPAQALVQMLSGSAEWRIGGQNRTLSAGEFLHMPAMTPHSVRATEPFSMLLTLIRDHGATEGSEESE